MIMAEQYCCIKDVFTASRITRGLTEFNITTILDYFIESHADYKDIRQSSYQMFDKGHVQDIQMLENSLAKKTLIQSTCVAQMKQTKYNLLIILLDSGDIDHASCTCPAGAGPRGTCKHLAALCYALEDFVRRFIKEEGMESRTQRLQEWNKPRLVNLPATPTYDINFEKKKFDKPSKVMCGQHPASYELNTICHTERSAAVAFLDDLRKHQTETKETIGLLQVINTSNPITTVISHEPTVDTYIREVNILISDLKGSDIDSDETIEKCLKILTPDPNIRLKISDETKEQVRCRAWHMIRKGRITGSVCDRVISFTGRVSENRLVANLFDPPSFSNAATQFGIQNEPVAIACYVKAKRTEGDHSLSVEPAGFYTDVHKGYLGASPDGIVSCGDGSRGIVEVKCPIKWSKTTPSQAIGDWGYPLTAISEIDQLNKVRITFKLKKSHKWFHQIQFQLYCCRDFAQFVDFAMYHCDTKHLHIERFLLQESWVQQNIPKIDNFYKKYMVKKFLS